MVPYLLNRGNSVASFFFKDDCRRINSKPQLQFKATVGWFWSWQAEQREQFCHTEAVIIIFLLSKSWCIVFACTDCPFSKLSSNTTSSEILKNSKIYNLSTVCCVLELPWGRMKGVSTPFAINLGFKSKSPKQRTQVSSQSNSQVKEIIGVFFFLEI